MEQIIGKLSEIETTAETIMKDALQKRKALSAEMERQSKEFDTQLEKQTEEQIKEIRRNLEGEKDNRFLCLLPVTFHNHLCPVIILRNQNHFL